jgi:hypothetical protein
VIGCIAAAQAEEKPSPKRSEYDEWVRHHTTASRTESFLQEAGKTEEVQVPLKLVITAVYGDEDPSNTWPEVTSYIYISADWRVRYVTVSSHDARGGWGSILKDDQTRLDQLLSRLPDDGSCLPPPNRRLALQVADGNRFRVYDRANAPDGVLGILRLARTGIGPWVPIFKPEGEVQVHQRTSRYQLAVTHNGLLLCAADDRLQLLDPTTHGVLREIPAPAEWGQFWLPEEVRLSPDGRLMVIAGSGWCGVLDTETWRLVPRFDAPRTLFRSSPRFTADGRFLLLQCRENYEKTATLRAYDTMSGESRGKLPSLPDGVLDYVEGSSGKHAVILLKERILSLWDITGRREDARLAKGVSSCKVAFSPDESAVAIAQVDDDPWARYRIRIWKTDTGKLEHELYPAQAEAVEGLQWTPDARFVFAAMRWPSPDDYTVHIWSARSGRLRGILNTNLFRPIGGVVMLPDGRHLAISGSTSDPQKFVVRFWDFAAALKQIRTFEDSLAGPQAGK